MKRIANVAPLSRESSVREADGFVVDVCQSFTAAFLAAIGADDLRQPSFRVLDVGTGMARIPIEICKQAVASQLRRSIAAMAFYAEREARSHWRDSKTRFMSIKPMHVRFRSLTRPSAPSFRTASSITCQTGAAFCAKCFASCGRAECSSSAILSPSPMLQISPKFWSAAPAAAARIARRPSHVFFRWR